MKKTILPLLLTMLLGLPTAAQPGRSSLAGSWLGRLESGALSIRVIFNLSVTGNDSLIATMDSPDQGVKNIRMGRVTLEEDRIRIPAPLLLGDYSGTIRGDSVITGTWKQSGQTFPLVLHRLKEKFTLIRPQEPKPPFPYISEEVTFRNDKAGIDLAGTLTLPEGKGPFRAAVLISGSGAQNRDEELMGHKPFMVIADHLTRNGIAVLRYDDRGVGKSKGNFIASTSADFATDAAAAISFLRKDTRIIPNEIGLIGHSEGGLIAPITASSENVKFIVSLAGPGVTGEQIILWQSAAISRLSGVSDDEIRKSVDANRKLFSILKKEPDNMKASEKMGEAYGKILDKNKVEGEEREKALKQIKASLNPGSLTWFRYFVSTDPSLYWKKVKCPVLALNGEKDTQVSAEQNLPGIEKALRNGGNKSVTAIKLPGLNHLFQESKTGLPSEYGNIEETFSAEVLKIMTEWIKSL